MNRREFLIRLSQVAVGGIVTALLPFEAQAKTHAASPAAGKQPRLFKGTHTGKILESLDGGKSWRICTDLGSQYAVLKVYQKEAQILAEVRYQGSRFALKSADGYTWYTAEWVPPQG
jgi:hypothetical protein